LLSSRGSRGPQQIRESSPAVPAIIGLSAPAGQQAEPPTAAAEKVSQFAQANRDVVYRRLLTIADALAAACALLITIAAASRQPLSVLVFATIPLIVVMSKAFGTYEREDLLVRKSTLDEAPQLFQLATLYALAVWLLYGLIIGGGRERRELLLLWISLFGLLLLFRAISRSISRRLTTPERCLVVGDQATSNWMQTKFARRRSLHAIVVATVVPDESRNGDGTPALGDASDLQALASQLLVDRIVIAPGTADLPGVIDVVHAATTAGLKVSVLPRVLEIVGTSVQFDDVEGVPLLSMRPLRLTRSSRILKRGLDVIGAAFGLVILSPLLAGITCAIKLDSAGPALFRQRRVGRDGGSFEMIKFRTMVRDADEHKDTFRHLNQASGLFKIANDPRMTRVGRFLRRTSLDELPQLVNVLRGEMSLVGPRPLIADEDRQIEGWRRRRLRLTPGMTGHWQVLGSARLPLEEMARIDYLYVTNWSLWLDIKILLRTVPYVLARRGM
jgi:exopolysaccharide biosynthesis polyprenyl glycosylphosphotransferase